MPTAVDDTSSSPSPSPNGSPLLLGFRPPSSPPSPESPSETSPESPEDLAPASADEWAGPEPSDSPDDTSSPGSTPEPEAVKVDLFSEEELQQLARGGVATAGEKAHEWFAATEGQREVGLYLTDPEDQANIGDPLASIAARHQGVAGKVNPDTKDLLSAMVGLFGYATKQLNRRTEARALDAGSRQPQPMPQAVDL